jgi:hypothetical protein
MPSSTLVRCDLVAETAQDVIAEHVRVSPDHLRGHVRGDVLDVERLAAARRGDVRVEDHLVQNIAEFFDELVSTAALDRVDELVGLLDEVLHERFVGLFGVPGAPSGRPEAREYGDELVELRMRLVGHAFNPAPSPRRASSQSASCRAGENGACSRPTPRPVR